LLQQRLLFESDPCHVFFVRFNNVQPASADASSNAKREVGLSKI